MRGKLRPCHARGFTLIELLVVLALAAVAAGVVGRGAQAYLERARYQKAVRDVSAELKRARMTSVDSGQPVLVAWQPEEHRLVLQTESQHGGGGVSGQVAIPDALDVQVQPLAMDLLDPALAPVFLFDPNGGASGGAIQVLRNGRGVLFEVNWLLGTVQTSQVES